MSRVDVCHCVANAVEVVEVVEEVVVVWSSDSVDLIPGAFLLLCHNNDGGGFSW